MLQMKLFPLLVWIFLRHPFFVSVTEIDYRSSQQSVQITHKIFWDDLEKALNETGPTKINLLAIEDTTAFNAVFEKYLNKNFSLAVNDKPVNLTFIGWEIEGDAFWCYQEATKIKNLSSVSVRNQMLVETFKNQENLVHVKKDGSIKSARLGAELPEKKLSFK